MTVETLRELLASYPDDALVFMCLQEIPYKDIDYVTGESQQDGPDMVLLVNIQEYGS